MYAPHTVTLFNVTESGGGESIVNVTKLQGVFCDVAQGANIKASGLESVDAATLFIPFNIRAVNAQTGRRQVYVSPKQYALLPDVSGYWTLRTSGSGSAVDCFFARGVVDEVATFQTINRKYDDVYRVSHVDDKDYGSAHMRHWEVGGR